MTIVHGNSIECIMCSQSQTFSCDVSIEIDIEKFFKDKGTKWFRKKKRPLCIIYLCVLFSKLKENGFSGFCGINI